MGDLPRDDAPVDLAELPEADRTRGDDLLEWCIPGVVAGGLLGVLVAASAPGWWFPVAFVSVVVVLVGLVTWTVRVVVEAVADAGRSRTNDGGPDRRTHPGALAAMVVVPALVVTVGGLVVADVPLRLRWQLSRPAFDEEVHRGLEVAPYVEPVRRIGLYDVRGIERFGDAVVFREATGGFLGEVGFADLPDGPTDELVQALQLESLTFRELGDGWYAWTASF